MISAHRLIFNGFSTDDFDVIPYLSFGGDDGATPSYLNAEGVYTEHYDGHRTIHRAKYNEAFTPRFTLIKKDESDFNTTENRKILSWLTASEKPGFLEVYKDDSNVLDWKIFGCITSVEQYKLGNGRIVGYEFEMESSHPYAWSRKLTYPEVYETTKEIGNNDETNDYLTVSGDKTFTITCNTDEYNKPLYPKVTITFKGENEYFPIDVNPLEENTYPMVPNVIYSWVDAEGIKHLYVNLNSTEHNGRYTVEPLTSDTEASDETMEYKYCYFPEENIIKTTIKTVENGVISHYWEPITHIGMAVKVNNTYVVNGTPTTKEAIIAGGTMDETIILDGTNKIISGTKGISARIIGDDFNWEWIPLAYGENNITVMGNCTIKFEWLEPRKVGSL